MRLLAALAFAAVLSCATSAAPNSLVRNKRFLNLNLGGIVNGLVNPVLDTVEDVVQTLTCALQPILGNLLQAVSDLITGLLKVVVQLIASLTGLLRQASLLEPLADTVDSLIPTVDAAVSGLEDGGIESLVPVVTLVNNLISGVVQNVDDLSVPLVSDIVSTAGNILENVFQIASELLLKRILGTFSTTNLCGPQPQGNQLSPQLQAPSLTPSGSALVEVGFSSLTLTCETTSEGSITYTFLQDGTEVQSSESNTYNVSSLDITASGTYTCVASSGDENSTSPDSYVLTVVDVSVTSSGVCRAEGEDIPVTLTCAATSDGPFIYTFFQDGTEVQSSESTTYTISSPQSSDAGVYRCKVANGEGEVNSSDSYTLYIYPNDKAVRPAVRGTDPRFQPLCYQNTLYYIHEDSFSNLDTSLSKCRQGGPGGMMAEYNDRDEINAIKAYLLTLRGFEYVHIGARYDVSTKQWRLLSTGEVLPVTDWLPNEPAIGSAFHCVELTYHSVAGWGMYAWLCSIVPPNDNIRFMCELQSQ